MPHFLSLWTPLVVLSPRPAPTSLVLPSRIPTNGTLPSLFPRYPNKQESRPGGRKGYPPKIVPGFIYLQDISQKRINIRQNIDFSRLARFLGGVGSGSNSNLFSVTYQRPPMPSTSRSSSPPPPEPGAKQSAAILRTFRVTLPVEAFYPQVCHQMLTLMRSTNFVLASSPLNRN